MSDSVKAGAALPSPKILKNSKGTVLPTNQLAHVEYGCEHIQALLSAARVPTFKQYRSILQRIHEDPSVIIQTHKQHDGRPAVSLRPLYLCLQCPSIATEAERDQHVDTKGHVFSAESRSGHIYCGHCQDFIYDPELENRRLLKGKKRRLEDVTNAEDHKLTISHANFLPCRAIGLRGLYNMGQTCFMSVVLQTLIHNPFIRNFYLSEGHKKEDCQKEGCVSCALDEMFVEFHSNEKTEGFGAVNMLMGSWLAGEALAGYSQQDAHEYMQFMLNTLHLQNDGVASNDCRCIVHQTFYGKLCSTVTCDSCHNTNTAEDPYMDLSLDVRNLPKKRRHSVAEEAKEPSVDLRDCLERFTSVETLSAEDYTCQKCKARQGATKQLSVRRLPPVLCIHLKRFEHSKSTSSKIETRLSFPLTLDIYPYTTPQSASIPTDRNPDPNLNVNSPERRIPYALSGVIVHKGKIDSGHYVSYSREGNDWFRFDDSKVVLVSEKEVLAAQAYLLFYMVESLDVTS
ncbi:ubiquitin carboxyl-terminal hydrolase 2 [Sporormia fimetaria CBS 119925]|uniref:Ubiquitin carboxyl-terminal hydrolase n=1 Tax=Sporormia fimetaria CBS 119925 TaxID=1340428 RepID=A0A6A6V3F9_9PLEO|nr:ubiquitin carboxyl-terminal hydrolase 2 [Sporormia fimetaria CBS 119925]